MSKNLGLFEIVGYCSASMFVLIGGCSGYSAPPAPAVPVATISTSSVNFAATPQGASSSPTPITLTNTGTAALDMVSVVAGGANPGDFSNTNGCTGTLAIGANCTISVTFTPTATGTRSETITITDSALNSPQVISVTGAANPPLVPAVSISPASVSFTATNQGASSSPTPVTLTNTGTMALEMVSVVAGGANPGDFSNTNGCTGSLAINASCTISVTFTPTATGTRSETITITDNAPNSPQIISVTGTANPPLAPAVSISPASVSFAATNQGASSGPTPVTVTNTGTAALNIASVVTGGGNPGDFPTVNGCTGSLAINASCTISVTFTPTATGPRSETITITDNAPNSPQVISVTGTANPPLVPAVTILPASVSFAAIVQGTSSGPTPITVTNTGTAALNITSVVPGGSNPGDFATANGCTGSIAVNGTCTINVTFTPMGTGTRGETITITDNAANSPQVISVSGTGNPIVVSVTPPTTALATGESLQFTASDNDANDTIAWSVSAAGGASAGTIDATGHYTAPSGAQSALVTVTATSQTDNTKSASAVVNVVAPGVFANTNNVQVAQYTVSPPAAGNVSVQFGLDTSYGLTTWTQPVPAGGGAVSLFVAGMKASSTYHMRGVIQFADGSQFNDADFTFTTGALAAGTAPNITVTTTAGMTPQPGVEMLDLVNIGVASGQFPVAVSDLSGNVLWGYNPGLPAGVIPNPIKLLPNGHFLINFGGANPDGANSVLQEVDLGGNIIWQMTAAQLNAALASATCAGCNITVIGTHHDFVLLPNGHLIVLAATQQSISGTTVTGDVLIDLDQNHNPVWLWNEFDHLDTNRRPYLYPDWTHTNAVIYSKDDGNLIISIRHQNWLVKIDYNNGAGTGDILWKLGAVLPTDSGQDVADFQLLNADGTPDTNNEDWFFAQHGPAFVSSNTTGQFSLVLFDNGDDRGVVDVAGGTCGTSQPVSCFSTAPVFEIDEAAKTAQFIIHPQTPDYSLFGGNAEALANTNVEYDECDDGSLSGQNARILEVTQSPTPQTVWSMQITGQFAYRGFRMPSLYPGVQW